MGDEWSQGYNPENNQHDQHDRHDQSEPEAGKTSQADIDKRLEELKNTVVKGAGEAQQRIKRVVDKAGEYWQQVQTPQTPQTPQPQPETVEEQRIRHLANMWSHENWRIARDLGNYMEVVAWRTDEVWEVTLQTRWETRTMEAVAEPYAGRAFSSRQPLLPVWDYELASVSGLKAPANRTRIDGLDEVAGCTICNGTGRTLCSNCAGRGWIVCPDCKGRTKKRCSTCRGRGYVADWAQGGKKPFFKKQAEGFTNSINEKVADVFDGIRNQGVPIPNPVDTDPANKGKTVPCPDCINGEVDCTCGNGKRICETCEGTKSSICANCNGTGKVVRHREIARSFDLRIATKFVGKSAIPERLLTHANGDLVYNAELDDSFYADMPPEGVPMDVWQRAIELAQTEHVNSEKTTRENAQSGSRATLQVIELIRIPYTSVDYRYSNQDYTFYIYDSEGQEKFYADRYPARWDRIERLVRAITTDLTTSASDETTVAKGNANSAYRVPVEVPPYTIEETEDGETDEDSTEKRQ